MLTQPRLALLNPTNLVSRARRAAIEKMFGGIYPGPVQLGFVKTRLERGRFERWRRTAFRGSDEWSRPQMEMLGAFVSARNGCVF